MTAPRTADRDRGSASLFLTVLLPGLLLLLGLVIDGGLKARAIAAADTLAAQTARTAAQALDVPSVLTGTRVAADPAQARAAAQTYLTANHATGTVTIADRGRRITVHVTLTRPTTVLGLIGIHQITAHGSATATLTTGITEAIP